MIYMGDLENRCRFALEIAESIKKIPKDKIIGARITEVISKKWYRY